jgi:SAM-dependent methyltransferase
MFEQTIKTLKNKLIREQFRPSLLGILVNPFYISRRGLFNNIKHFGKNIVGKTLDVGCGIKPYENLFSSSQYIGLDIEQSGHNHLNSKVDVYYDGKTFPFNDNEFDTVVTFQVFEHVFNPSDFLKEINRVLKPDGELLMAVPFVWDEHEQPYDYARYSSFGLKHILSQHGFTVVELRKSVNDFGVIFQLINAYIFKVLSANIFTKLLSLLFIIPTTIAGIVFSIILPKNNDLYLDNVLLIRKAKDL